MSKSEVLASDEQTDEKSLESLLVWQKALALAVSVYRQVLPLLPQEEKWILGSQIRRSAQSVPANIAEGYGRYYFQDTVRFCTLPVAPWKKPTAILSLRTN